MHDSISPTRPHRAVHINFFWLLGIWNRSMNHNVSEIAINKTAWVFKLPLESVFWVTWEWASVECIRTPGESTAKLLHLINQAFIVHFSPPRLKLLWAWQKLFYQEPAITRLQVPYERKASCALWVNSSIPSRRLNFREHESNELGNAGVLEGTSQAAPLLARKMKMDSTLQKYSTFMLSCEEELFCVPRSGPK